MLLSKTMRELYESIQFNDILHFKEHYYMNTHNIPLYHHISITTTVEFVLKITNELILR